jgi:CS1 type fimbrial major subunit.
MNMKTSFIATVVALATVCSFSASAAQKDITVTASVDSTIEFLQADGSSLPSTIKLDFLPGTGLAHKVIKTRVYSNDMTKAVNVKLLNTPQLANVVDPTQSIDVDVKLGGKSLTTSDTKLDATTLFPGGKADLNGGSVSLDLDIGQKGAAAAVLPAGDYSGMVSVVLSQATA